MSAVVVLTPEQLRTLIVDAVREALETRSPDPPEWISVEEAAELLGCCTKTVKRFAKDGKLPAGKVGRKLRFRRTDVEVFPRRLREVG